MTDDEISNLKNYPWMPSRIPRRDALTTFVPDGPEPDPMIVKMQERLGQSVWYPTEGGFRLLLLYDGGEYDRKRFTVEASAWDHEHCSACQEHIPAMTLCYVTEPEQPYIALCSTCHEKHVVSES